MITAQWRTDVSQPPSQSVVNNGGHVFGYHKVMLGTSVQGYHQSTFVSLARPCGILMCRIINIDTFKLHYSCSYAQQYCKWVSAAMQGSYCVVQIQGNCLELQLYLFYSISFCFFFFYVCHSDSHNITFLGCLYSLFL